MQKEFEICRKCQKPVLTNQPYVSINRNIEMARYNVHTGGDDIEIIDSQQIFILCMDCGDRFNDELFTKLLLLLPNTGEELNN